MPHAELKYAASLEIDAPALLQGIERILQAHDPGSGDCKGRAYPAPQSHHAHMIVEISLLPKPHRDAAFMAALRQELWTYLSDAVPRPCWLSLNMGFNGPGYVTEELT